MAKKRKTQREMAWYFDALKIAETHGLQTALLWTYAKAAANTAKVMMRKKRQLCKKKG